MEPPQIAAVICALLSSAVLALSASYEATFRVLSRATLEKLVEGDVKFAAAMLRAHEPRQRLRLMGLSGISMGVTGLSLATAFLLRCLPVSLPTTYALALAAPISLALALLLSLPRRIRFTDENEATRIPPGALLFVPLHHALAPLAALLDRLASGDSTDEDFRAEKEEELRSLVEAESESGVIEEGEREMIQGVFGFHDRIVREVMIPRVDIQAIDSSSSLSELLELIKSTGHSRVPVYEETLDHILGLVYAKDLLQLLAGRGNVDLDATTIARFRAELDSVQAEDTVPLLHTAHYVPETKKIDALFHEMREKKIRLAIVFDEYGGTAGVVSTEDLVEEIVGDIQDEYDDEEELSHWVEPDRVLLASGRIDIDDLNELLETSLPNEGFETLGGFILDHLGRIPEEGQMIELDNLTMKILRVEGQRIAQVEIAKHPSSKQYGQESEEELSSSSPQG